MKLVYYIAGSLIAFFLLVIIGFSLYMKWPVIESKIYLMRSTELGTCYREYNGKVEFVSISHNKKVLRNPLPIVHSDKFTIIDTFCTKEFSCLNCAIWAYNDEHVFYQSQVIHRADPYSFVPLSSTGYSKDERNVFYKNIWIVGADPKTFQLLNFDIAKDDKNIFLKETILKNIKDPHSFSVIDYYCWKDDSTVYLNQEIIENSDPATFEVVACKYEGKYKFFVYKDKNAGYILDLNKDFHQRSEIKDITKVYIIKNIDANSFEAFSTKYYTHDKNQVYFKDRVVLGANPGKFKPVSEYYAIEDNKFFYKERIINNIDSSTFRVLSQYVAIDKNYAFYEGILLVDAIPDKIKILNDYYSSDGVRVYYKTRLIENADAKTFKITNPAMKYEARDKNASYRKGRITSK